jgi:hypothetical protein
MQSLVQGSVEVHSVDCLVGRVWHLQLPTVMWSYHVVAGRNLPGCSPLGFPGLTGRVVDLPRSSDLRGGWLVQPIVVRVPGLLVPVTYLPLVCPPQGPFHPFIGNLQSVYF